MAKVNGKAIIVTGGGSGVGRAAALLLTADGARVMVADTNEAGGRETVKLCEQAGGAAHFIRTDIASEAEVQKMVEATVAAFGRLDGAFNNAAIPQISKLIHEMPLDEWQRALDVNLTGTFLCIKHEVKAMLATGGGAIVNTASAAGATAFPMAAEYVSSKHAVVGLTKAAAVDYGKLGIRVNAILPGAIRTPMLTGKFAEDPNLEPYLNSVHPIGRFSEPEEIAAAAVWLLSDDASFVHGSSLSVDGGYIAM